MSDKIKRKQVTKKTKHKIADPEANDSVCLFFAAAHFLKTILAIPHLANEVLPDILADNSQNQKSQFLTT